jgi:hypothetical protein
MRLEQTKYNSLQMSHIYFCDGGKQIKVAHSKLFNYKSNLTTLYENSSEKNIYLSPEEM